MDRDSKLVPEAHSAELKNLLTFVKIWYSICEA